ncbi:hypothetical protein NEOLEDRAFT_1136975 [Neolentinus lepideus HHB14362 ss-1]|uniref:DUF2415 domain-containing protein n=1 Tax=Neolentinus lepideus HHB14362 ss-1 TaxID=1314782 RepID=A0A165QZE8_9AGAM|nr:hypothetical protein NEOLEDRAFT_1136975 [Neolentinus lepideus HHB14362 ss-1]
MAHDSTLLSSTPTSVAPTRITINHVQLRDLIICPKERGIVNYVQERTIVEHDVCTPYSVPRTIAKLSFVPNTLASLQLPGATLFAAGGQDAQLHLSLHTPTSLSSDEPALSGSRVPTQCVWREEHDLRASINNSVTFTTGRLNLTRTPESKVEPRVVVSNNNGTVRFFDIGIRSRSHTLGDAGTLKLDVAVNHSSVSPDGRTLLSVGDSSHVLLHHLSDSSRLTFTPISTLTLPPASPSLYGPASSVPASFSTAFSPNGSKFAVASQEGMVVVWDVRSSKPFKMFESDKSRLPSWCRSGNGSASGWIYDDPWDWAMGGAKAPGWGFRCVKFNDPAGHGKELMTFTEHTSLLHVVDARTFETENIIRIPNAQSTEPLVPAARTNPAARIRPRAVDHGSSLVHRSVPRSSSSARSSSSPLPRIVVFSNSPPESTRATLIDALEERRRTRERVATSLRSDSSDDENENVVLIPPFEDSEEEEGIRRILGRHGIRARTTRERNDPDMRERLERRDETEMDPDGEDADMDACVSSREPSRAGSPVPAPPIHVPMPVQPSDTLQVRAARPRPSRLHRHARRGTPVGEGDLDLAGVCFDPMGSWVYVASMTGVMEWSVRGAEKRWWYDSEWA